MNKVYGRLKLTQVYPNIPLSDRISWIFQETSLKNYYILAQVQCGRYSLICLNDGNRLNDPGRTHAEVFGTKHWTHETNSITIGGK